MSMRRSRYGQRAAVVAIWAACSGCDAPLDGAAPVPASVQALPDAGAQRAASDAAVAVPPSNASSAADAASEVAPAPSRCVAPEGVSSRPATIGEAVALMNALPRPTTLACFIESLARPLDVYFSKSQLSAQPADGPDNPRTFIVNGALFLSSVPSGYAQNTLELGFRTGDERAIRGEIVFPLRAPVSASTMAEHIELGERFTICGLCHAREARTRDPFLGELAFESDLIAPNPDDELGIEAVRALATTCDPLVTPERCARLSALFDHGALRPSRVFDAAR